MQDINYQYVIAGLLLLIAIIYVVRSITKSVKNEDCTDCGIPVQKKPAAKSLFKKLSP